MECRTVGEYTHNEMKMKAFLAENYRIPHYQRSYSWDVKELNEFWRDLKDRCDDDSKHFFGMIVVHTEGGIQYIIDGQQRTTTSYIFLSVLRDFYYGLFNTPVQQDADFKRSTILTSFLGQSINPHIVLCAADDSYFREHIISTGNPPSNDRVDRRSNDRIRKAYLFFKKKIDSDIQNLSAEKKKDYLDKLLTVFVENFSIIRIGTTDLSEAFIIFETLNARGKELAASDLLKNFILQRSADQSRALKLWNTMSDEIDDDLTAYIRYFWNSMYPLATKKRLYSLICDYLNDQGNSDSFLEELMKSYEIYYDLKNEGSSKVVEDNSPLRTILDALIAFGAQTYYPIIISLFRKGYSQSDIALIANSILIYIFRNTIVCGIGANVTEDFFNEIACDISSSSPDKQSIVQRITERIVDDETFRSAFRKLNFSKESDVIRYILRSIHIFMARDNQELNMDNTKVHIEHVMPKDSSLWSVTEDVHKAYLWRLGNLTLLAGPLNKSASNRPFLEKKPRYEESMILPTRMLLEYNEWGPEQIEDRQAKMADMAVEIWKIPQ